VAALDVQPYPAAERRTLHVFRKVAPTPERFPRRPGMAVKRPLVRRTSR
jgi:16S rRNA (guanine527-N7)-methyltransferase